MQLKASIHRFYHRAVHGGFCVGGWVAANGKPGAAGRANTKK